MSWVCETRSIIKAAYLIHIISAAQYKDYLQNFGENPSKNDNQFNTALKHKQDTGTSSDLLIVPSLSSNSGS